MIDIRPATMRDVSFLAANMREQDWREVHASAPTDDKAEAGILCHMASRFAWTVWIKGDPVCAFGFAQMGLPWLWSAWAFGTDRIKRAIPAVTRFGRETASRMLLDAGARRCEIRSIADHDLAHRWLQGLGAHRECELPEYGRNGETFVLYSWTIEDWKHVLYFAPRHQDSGPAACPVPR